MRIAVLICSLVFDSQKAFMKGIERRIRDWGDVCSVFCCHVNITGNDTYSKGEYSIFNLPDLSKFDGVVFVRNTFQDSIANNILANRILSADIPCVCIDDYSPEFVNIMSDEHGIMEEVTKHLIEAHGCKKFYFLGGQESSNDTQLRYRGFRDTLQKYNLPFKDEWCIYGNFEYSSGLTAAEYFLNLEPILPDAIVCCNDEMAVGLMTELKRRGLKIPKDIKVTGVDFDSVSRIYTPKLTTAKRQQYQKGVNAINVLHEFGEHVMGETITLPISLYCGASCGCTPEDDGKADVTSTNSLAVDKYCSSELTQNSKRMIADLMSVRNHGELIEELKEHALGLRAEEMYLCLNVRPDYLIDYSDYAKALTLMDRDNSEEYSDYMISSVSVVNGQIDETNDQELFETGNLFPPKAKGGKTGGTYYFLPIHYMNRNFGYAILGTSGELVRNDFFPNWCSTASNAFENTRKRSVMEQMITALDHMWIYDTLTGIYNRAGFFKLSEGIIADSIENKLPVCVVFLDVDGLKKVNDAFGHDEGDHLIRTVADIMKDIKHHGEIVMRYGGDEFVLLAAGYSDADAANCVLRIEKAMQEVNESEHRPYAIEASIGYCITTLKDSNELNELIENADREMYKKKNIKKASFKKV